MAWRGRDSGDAVTGLDVVATAAGGAAVADVEEQEPVADPGRLLRGGETLIHPIAGVAAERRAYRCAG